MSQSTTRLKEQVAGHLLLPMPDTNRIPGIPAQYSSCAQPSTAQLHSVLPLGHITQKPFRSGVWFLLNKDGQTFQGVLIAEAWSYVDQAHAENHLKPLRGQVTALENGMTKLPSLCAISFGRSCSIPARLSALVIPGARLRQLPPMKRRDNDNMATSDACLLPWLLELSCLLTSMREAYRVRS